MLTYVLQCDQNAKNRVLLTQDTGYILYSIVYQLGLNTIK